MEELLLAQVRGLLVMAEYHRNERRLYMYYLGRANNVLSKVEELRQKKPHYTVLRAA